MNQLELGQPRNSKKLDDQPTDNFEYALKREMMKFNGKVLVGDGIELNSDLTSQTGKSRPRQGT